MLTVILISGAIVISMLTIFIRFYIFFISFKRPIFFSRPRFNSLCVRDTYCPQVYQYPMHQYIYKTKKITITHIVCRIKILNENKDYMHEPVY